MDEQMYTVWLSQWVLTCMKLQFCQTIPTHTSHSSVIWNVWSTGFRGTLEDLQQIIKLLHAHQDLWHQRNHRAQHTNGDPHTAEPIHTWNPQALTQEYIKETSTSSWHERKHRYFEEEHFTFHRQRRLTTRKMSAFLFYNLISVSFLYFTGRKFYFI